MLSWFFKEEIYILGRCTENGWTAENAVSCVMLQFYIADLCILRCYLFIYSKKFQVQLCGNLYLTRLERADHI